jgi:hypothetical protein
MARVQLVASCVCARFHRIDGGCARCASHNVVCGVVVEPGAYLLYKAKKNQKQADVRLPTTPVLVCVRVHTLVILFGASVGEVDRT